MCDKIVEFSDYYDHERVDSQLKYLGLGVQITYL